MKRILFTALIASSMYTAHAENAPIVADETIGATAKVHFGILDNNALIATETVNRTKNGQMCWLIDQVPAYTTLNIREQLSSPPNAHFSRTDTTVQVNESATEHILEYQITTGKAGQWLQCWAFGQQDPIGMYTETLEINGVKIAPYTFQVIR